MIFVICLLVVTAFCLSACSGDKDDDKNKIDFAKKNVIRLSTTKQVKGIDSPIVVLLLTENFTNPEKNGNIDSMTQMNSIYSCITRTMDLLYVQITKDALSENLEKGENAITKLKKIWNE